MKVRVLSYNDFKQVLGASTINDKTVKNFEDTIFISILDTGTGWFSKRQFKEDHKNVLTLKFDDVTVDGESSPTNHFNTQAFTEKNAESIVTFLENNKNASFCMIHCAAGISRSGAIGQFINDYFRGDYNEFRQMNPRTIPNQMIIRKLNKLMR